MRRRFEIKRRTCRSRRSYQTVQQRSATRHWRKWRNDKSRRSLQSRRSLCCRVPPLTPGFGPLSRDLCSYTCIFCMQAPQIIANSVPLLPCARACQLQVRSDSRHRRPSLSRLSPRLRLRRFLQLSCSSDTSSPRQRLSRVSDTSSPHLCLRHSRQTRAADTRQRLC